LKEDATDRFLRKDETDDFGFGFIGLVFGFNRNCVYLGGISSPAWG
jgi:hypothetical protein